MKLHFESNLDFQLQAIDAVCDLFRGQEVCRTEFTILANSMISYSQLEFEENNLGVGNRLTLPDEILLENLKRVQLRNGVPPSDSLISGDFTIEMETGTGKTYVYLRTIFELNKRYGFTKFVIVVPSIAIKEGVYKTLQITEEHFRKLYSGTPFDYFLYNSAKLDQVRNFASNSQVQIMVVTVGAINKKNVNNLYKDNEKTGGETPIDLIRATRPVLIVDEPQSVDGGIQGRGREALENMHALCTLRYSATHVDQHHMVYRLDAVDAYERKLVKQVEVASATIEDAHNKPYVRLLSTNNRRGQIFARIELDVESGRSVSRKERSVMDGDDLELLSGRAVYKNCHIGEICVERGREFIELRYPGGAQSLQLGESFGDIETDVVQREMIRRTIREHFEKERRLRSQGIKVLSLFFVDSVARYRQYDENGQWIKGEYAEIFEAEYRSFTDPEKQNFKNFFDPEDIVSAADQVHNGYFSIDKKKKWTDTAENNQANRDNAERAYNLIMRDKEKLLSLDTPLKFIFSHSALREGWDNPNVFQICVLRDIHSEQQRRQTIGRGLRLCVNQEGLRQHGFDMNTLTVIARENYETFAENLQKEIEQDTGIRFGVIEHHQFATIPDTRAQGDAKTLGFEASKLLWQFLEKHGYVDADGRIQDLLRKSLKDETLVLPDRFTTMEREIIKRLHRFAG